MTNEQPPGFDGPPPTTQMPATGAGGPGTPPVPPTGFGAGDEYQLPDPEQRNNTPFIVGGVVAVLAIAAVVGALLFSGGDDDNLDEAVITDVSSTLVETTVPDTSTTIVDTTTSLAETTTTVAETTTTTTTTTTTVAPTTAPPTTVAPTTAPATTTPIPVVTVPPAPATTLWDVIVNSPDLSQFRAAVEAAGLIDLLDGPEAVTVFVPSNAAIDTFNAGVGNEGLINDPAFLRHHILSGLFTSADVFAATELATQAGDVITVDSASVSLDGGAKLVVVDVQAAGSVLHVVDMVLSVQ